MTPTLTTATSSTSSSPTVNSVPLATSYNISAEPFVFNATNSKKNKQSKKGPNPSAEQSEISFLKLQLNAAITRITHLDSEMSDYEKKVKILTTTVKSYEERDNKVAYEQNFSSLPSTSPSGSPSTCPHQPCPPPINSI